MDQIFKIIELIMNVTAAKSQTVSKQLMTTARKIIIFVIISLGAMALFCVGVSMAVADLAKQYDDQSTASWTGSVTIGLLLASLSLSLFFYCLSQKAWLSAASINDSAKKAPSPIEEALAILIKDIVVERQIKRQTPQTTESTNS